MTGGARGSRRAKQSHPAGGQSIIYGAVGPRLPASGAIWDELHTFLAVAEHKSVSRAAEALALGRSTVTRQIRRVQDVVGQQLVVLTKHGAFLTAEGEELFRDLARIDREVLLATKGLRAKGISPEGNVRIGISDGLGFVFLVPKIEAFSRDFSKVHLHFTRPLPFHALRENKMDVVVGFEPDLSSDVVSERVGTVHFVPFAGAKYVAQNGMPRLHDIERHSLIATHRFAGGDTWDAWQSLALRGKTTHSCDTSVTYGMMVKAGLGIGLLPSYVVCDPSFVPLELGVCVDVPLYAVALRERVKARAVGIALNLVRSTLQETPWLAGELTLDVKANGVPPGYNALFNLSEADLCPAVAY